MFALLMLTLCVILHTMWSGKYVVLVYHQYDVCNKTLLAVCVLVGMVV